MRADNWHDLFNVLVWCTFPRAKAALNACHVREMGARSQGGAEGLATRSPNSTRTA